MNNLIRKLFSMLLCIGILGANNVFAKNIYPSYTYTRTDSGKLFYDIAVGTTTSVAVEKMDEYIMMPSVIGNRQSLIPLMIFTIYFLQVTSLWHLENSQ